MRKTRELLLAGTMVPVLIGAGPGFAASPPTPTPWLMAQAEPGGPAGEEHKRPGPGAPGAAPHQAPEGRPAAPPHAAEPPAPRQAAPEAPRPAAPKPEAPAHQAPPVAPRAAEPEPVAPRAAPKPAAPQPHAEEAPAAKQPAPHGAEPEAPARAAPKAAAPETPEPRPAPKAAAPKPEAPKAAEPEAAPQHPAPKAAEPEATPAQRAAPKTPEPSPAPSLPNPAGQPRPNAEQRNAAPGAPANEAPAHTGAPRPGAEPNAAVPGAQQPGAEHPVDAAPNRMENGKQTAPNQAAPGQQPTPPQPAPGQVAPAQRVVPTTAPQPAPATGAAPVAAPPGASAQPNAIAPSAPAALAPAPANAARPAAPPPAPPPPPPPPPAAQAAPGQAQAPAQPGARRRGDRGDNSNGAIIGAAAGFVGGFLAAQAVQNFNQVQADRQVFTDDGVNIIREPGRTIIEQDDRYFIAHDENERFRDLGYNLDVRRADGYEVTSYATRDGSSVYTYTDAQGRLVRRVREYPDGRSVILIDNRYDRYDRNFVDDVVTLPPLPPTELPPPDRYIVDAADAPPTIVYDTLSAPPIAPLPRRYTLDQIRYSPDIRARMRSVDLNTITFASGSWTVSPDQAPKLASIASAINAAIRQNPKEIYMVEGYTDATGKPADNLSLSDRRAQSVATILTRDFQVPPENLVTQGYGSQFLKVQTQGPAVENRRVAVRRITPLLNQNAAAQ